MFWFMLNKKRNFKGDNGLVVNGFFSEFHHCCFPCLLRGIIWVYFMILFPPRTHTHTHSQKNRVIIESLMNELNAVREAWKREKGRVEINVAQSKLGLPLLHNSDCRKPLTMRDKWGLRFIKAPLTGAKGVRADHQWVRLIPNIYRSVSMACGV